MSLYDNLLVPENLYYAWKKARWLFRTADGYVDQAELAAFELDLEQQLVAIHREFESGTYTLQPLRPLPRPKKIEKGIPQNRQYFHVSVRDQVAWIAVVNAIGPIIDEQMPQWSYGNRIYRAAWYEKTDQGSKLNRGPYRHEGGHLYKKFQHAWPLFRRHVSITARAMVRSSKRPLREDLDSADQKALDSWKTEDLDYLNPAYWQGSRSTKSTKLFHAGIDLEKFYPRMKRSAVLSGLLAAAQEQKGDPRLETLLTSMLQFRVSLDDMPTALLENVVPTFSPADTAGIPTGLFVSGFLCNAAMLQIDETVSAQVHADRRVAHFRFVDDHVIVAFEFDELCKWIKAYKDLLIQRDIGANINSEKYDPDVLSEYLNATADSESHDELRASAMAATEIDGSNPTRLLTKTLAQVSEIAHANADLMDDDDLHERLKQLEWLLLADIPEREIRPDTRAAFAAGQIAATAPALIQDSVGLVAAARHLEQLRRANPALDPKVLRATEREFSEKQKKHDKEEADYLRKCFLLLMQAFKEFPNKARLFYRLHQYCQVTGYHGLKDIAEWIKTTRANDNIVWADYYTGLSQQILSNTALDATRKILSPTSLRQDRRAALQHLNDIAGIDLRTYFVPPSRRSWYIKAAQTELGVSLLSAAVALEGSQATDKIAAKLTSKGLKLVPVNMRDSSQTWRSATGASAGVWAHRIENVLSLEGCPSRSWSEGFSRIFAPEYFADALSQRRYPELLDDNGWQYQLSAIRPPDISDSGWFRDAIASKPERIGSALESSTPTIALAARSSMAAEEGWITASEWSEFAAGCAPFDPRASEWTALEITRQLVDLTFEMDVGVECLDRVHEHNVLISEDWKLLNSQKTLSWEDWRNVCRGSSSVKFRPNEDSIVDYRYYYYDGSTLRANIWERRFTAIGRLLLGLLQNNFDPPRLWNIRGLERIESISRGRLFQSLAISSPTLLILNACLSGRSSENRQIAINSSLFGWEQGKDTNDGKFDPPPIIGARGLVDALINAQKILEQNQLAVALNQPRQLIPFRLRDFSAGDEADQGGQADG